MNEREHPADVPVRGLKSLLKKPGQTRSKSHKNRVVINEKLNEFFAPDYIIFIEKECCADCEEECDCCCQEPEMIRIGNCKECRADLTRHLTNNSTSNNTTTTNTTTAINSIGDARYVNNHHNPRNVDILVNSGLDCDSSSLPTIRRERNQRGFGSEESQEEEEEEEEDDEEEEEAEDDEDEGEEEEEEVDEEDEEEEVDDEEEEVDEEDYEAEDSEETDKCQRKNANNRSVVNCVKTSNLQHQQQSKQHEEHKEQQQQHHNHHHHHQQPQQQQETLSPPEGYKDVCDEDSTLSGDDHLQEHPICGECNYYHHQRASDAAADLNDEGKLQIQGVEVKGGKETVRHGEDINEQQTSDQAQQTTPDLHQRYLVETITMTTVTERRIVREISEEETRPVSIDEADAANANQSIENVNNVDKKDTSDQERGVRFNESALKSTEDNYNNGKVLSCNQQQQQQQQQISGIQENSQGGDQQREGNDPSELSLTFKLGNVSLGLTNSLKPNSAVRQLFPDPRFISPPPAPTKAVVGAPGGSLEQGTDSDGSEAQKFLITTESLRLFDAVKRSKMAGSRSDSSESESSSIKRTIERNALRRSLICKYETSSRKKNLRSKDLTLEERIRQLTCVDQDDDNTGSSASETSVPTTTASVEAVNYGSEFPVRTSPSGEERPNKNEARLCSSRISTGANNIHETTTTTTLVQESSNTQHHHHHHHHHHHQSTYKRITDLFAQKKMVDANLPDLGLGDKSSLTKEYSVKSSLTKMNSDARKQFLASLAPLSCVASTGVESREDYYQLPSKHLASASSGGGNAPGNRDSIGYNSDSSYSLEDIEAALRGEERNYKNAGGPPDVTRGTPTGSGPEVGDATTDELLAFVEQDKSRTERIRRRYNEPEQDPKSCSQRNEESTSIATGGNGGQLATMSEHGGTAEGESATNNGGTNVDDEDDELNDYGFNRRPSVRGIKPQFESTSEIVRQLRSRSAIPSSLAEKTRATFHGPPWSYYELTGETSTEKQANTTFLLAAPAALPLDEDDQRLIYPDGQQHRDNNTITRINTMQKQIDDIYQTIAETAVSVQGTLERGSYLESTLPRTMTRLPINDSCHRYSHQEPLQSQKNGSIHYHEPQHQQHGVPSGRMLRIAGGGDTAPGNATVYNTLPTKSRRPQAVAISNYTCAGVPPIPQLPQQTGVETTKCYRTMYFVPYNSLSDPTYQNIQRILPPHSSANYANHIERYPYPRNGRVIDQTTLLQQQSQQHQLPPQQQPRYYARTVSGVPGTGTPPNHHNAQPPALHLHLHAQPDEFRFSGTPGTMQQHPIPPQTLQLQHHQHLPQLASYNNVQTVPTYSMLAPSRPSGPGVPGSGYAYSIHGASRAGAADVQTQTVSLSPPTASAATTCGSALLNTNYNNGTATHLGTVSSSPSNSSVLSSPTKIQQQQQRHSSCNVTERGVPEGAASAPSHDYSQTNNTSGLASHSLTNSFHGHPNNVPPPNTQNSVYYAMNV